MPSSGLKLSTVSKSLHLNFEAGARIAENATAASTVDGSIERVYACSQLRILGLTFKEVTNIQGRRQGGNTEKAKRSGERKSPSRVQGRSPSRESGDEVGPGGRSPREAEARRLFQVRKSPVGFRGEVPVEGLGDKVPRSSSTFATFQVNFPCHFVISCTICTF